MSPSVAVTVANPLAKARARETVALATSDILKAAPGFEVKKAVIVDASGNEVLSQLVDMNGDDAPDELVFQADFAAKESKTFKLKVGQRHPAARDDFHVYGRFVRERHDDFAWENDVVAHRVYGPDLETCAKEPLTSSGVDTWVKRVSKLVVNDWYMTDNYHQDVGEGADYYAVGKSRGLGGLGVWADGKLYVSKNFTHSRVLANGPIRLVFELSYAPWSVGGRQIGESRRVILDAGSQFNRFESTFTGAGDPLVLGVGIAKHAGSAAKLDARNASLRVWEPLDGGKGGNLGTALVFPSGTRLQQHDTDLEYLVDPDYQKRAAGARPLQYRTRPRDTRRPVRSGRGSPELGIRVGGRSGGMRMPMKVEYTLPGLIPRPVAPPISPETAGESFRAKLETLRGASVPVDWREILQLETRPAGAQHIGPPPRPADMRIRDGMEERGYWRRMLDSRLRAFEISKPGPEATPREAAAVGRMMSLLAAMQQAADEVVARHLSEEPR